MRRGRQRERVGENWYEDGLADGRAEQAGEVTTLGFSLEMANRSIRDMKAIIEYAVGELASVLDDGAVPNRQHIRVKDVIAVLEGKECG